jgi:hypothetical protein
MYPAEYYGDLFDLEDLPENVIAIGQDNQYQISFSKTNNINFPYSSGGNLRIALLIEGEVKLWERQSFDLGLEEWVGLQDTSSETCLIFEQIGNLSYVKDTFNDTYTITTSFSSGEVTREALCRWSGTDGNGCPLQLLYGGFGGDPETAPAEGGLKWSVSFQKHESPYGCVVSYGRIKDGFQDSPVGTYDISYATAGPESATVS